MKCIIQSAIACAGLLSAWVAPARTQSTFRETGTVTVGRYVVWVRGTNGSTVDLFVGRGFRDAFAPAHAIDAARLQHWVDSVRAAPAGTRSDSSVAQAGSHGAPIAPDVTMLRQVGGSLPGLRLVVSGEDPIQMPEPTARDFMDILDSAVQVAHELSPKAAPVIAAAPPAPAPAPPAAPPMGASTSEPPPELVLPTPKQAVTFVTRAVDSIPALHSTPAMVSAPITPKPVEAPAPATPPVPASAPVVKDSAASPHVDAPADKLIRTPLGPFTVPGAILNDRDKEAQYCYRQLGLRYNPELKGEITVKLSVSSDGAVQDVVITRRTWQGISAGEVESCVRALAHDWTVASSDPALTTGAKLLTFSFAP